MENDCLEEANKIVKRFYREGTGAQLIRPAHKRELTAAVLCKTPEEDLLDGKLDQPVEPPSPLPTPTPSPPTPPTPNPDPEAPPEPREPKPDTLGPSPGPIRVPPRTYLLRDRGSQMPRYLQPCLSPLRQKVRAARGYSGSRGNTPYVLENAAWTLSAATPSLNSGRKNPKLVWTGYRCPYFSISRKSASYAS